MTKPEVLKFKASAVRTITSPSDPDITTYFVYANMRDIPGDISMEINPRKPKMTTAVAKSIINAVKSRDVISFDIYNRGIVIAAKSVKFDSATSTVSVDMGDDDTRYGILDGGHTYTAIIKNRSTIPEDIEKFVKLEIIVGENLDVSALSDARNTSAQVSDIALFELDEKFDFVKEAICDEAYADKIAYKDNDDKPIPVIELIKLMFCFNIERFNGESGAPVAAYSSKAAVFKDYKEAYDNPDNVYKSLARLLPDFINLYETIQKEIPALYKAYKKDDGINGQLGKIKSVGAQGTYKSDFNEIELTYQIPTGFVLPIVGAFRALIVKEPKSNEINWRYKPLDVWKLVGKRLVQNTFDTQTNPQLAGKSKVLWQANYGIVDNCRKDLQIKELESKQ